MHQACFIPSILLALTVSVKAFSQEHGEQTGHSSSLSGYWVHTHTTVDTAQCSPELLERLRREEMVMEEYAENWPPTQNIFVDSDSVSWMDYPCQIYQKAPYFFSGDSVYLYTVTKPGQRAFIEENHLQLVSEGCITDSYVRQPVNPDSIRVLQEIYVNPICLLGIYVLKTHFTPEYPAYDEEHINLPPIKVQTKINLTSYAAAYKLISTGTIYLKVRDTSRLFYLRWNEFCNFDQKCVYRIILTPAAWWTGEPFDLEYRFEG